MQLGDRMRYRCSCAKFRTLLGGKVGDDAALPIRFSRKLVLPSLESVENRNVGFVVLHSGSHRPKTVSYNPCYYFNLLVLGIKFSRRTLC